MTTASHTRRALTLDGSEFFLYSGDIQYARTSIAQWRDSLAKIRAAGCNAIFTYVPWNWHELADDTWDWTGATHPGRNLPAFLAAVADAGLWCVLRPGPFITAEWVNGGIPSWLIQSHPEILTLDARGRSYSAVDYPPISYLHPTYERYAKRYFSSLVPIVRDYLASSGGPIIGVQIDDEPSYWQGLRQGPTFLDYNPVMVGDGERPGFYQTFLEKQYTDIENLNAIYRSDYPAFASVYPPTGDPRHPAEMPAHLDWYYCKLAAIAEHCVRLHSWIAELGVDVPLYMLFPYHTLQAAPKFMRFVRERGLTFLTGCECYISWPNVPTFGEDHVGTIAGIHEIHKTWSLEFGTPAMNFETQAGVAFHIPPESTEALTTLEIGHGLNGMSLYTIAGGETPSGYELTFGRGYDSSCPIGANGELREHYPVISRLGEFLKEWGGELVQTETLQDMAIGYYEPYEATSYLGNSLTWGLRDDYRDVYEHYFGVYYHTRRGPTLYTLLSLSGINYGATNLEFATLEELRRWPQLWILGLDFMSSSVQRKLVEYVESGGHLVMLPMVPHLDEGFEHCRSLDVLFPARARVRDTGTPFGRLTRHSSVSALGIEAMGVSDYIDTFDLPGDADPIATDNRNGQPCAYRRRHGEGSATLIGFKLSYWWDSRLDHKRFVDLVFTKNGGSHVASAEGWELVVRERASARGGFLFVVNPQGVSREARVSYRVPRTGEQATIPRFASGIALPRQGGLICPVDFDLGPMHLHYSTSQVQAVSRAPRLIKLKVHGQPNTVAEICLGAPGRPEIDVEGDVELLSDSFEDGRAYVTYRHGIAPGWIRLAI